MSLYARLGRLAYWLAWPGSWIYLRRSQRARLLLTCGNEILLVNNWLSRGRWNLPGGGLHRSEDPAVGLLRELKEETGISLQRADVQLLGAEMYRDYGHSYMCHYFTADVASKPASVPQRFEILDIAWVKIADISPSTHGPDVFRACQLLDTSRGL